MSFLQTIVNLFYRLRYPVSLPEDVANDLGIQLFPPHPLFMEFMDCLADCSHHPRHLNRFMPRKEAEKMFRSACRKDHFMDRSVFSYYLANGWLAFECIFDEKERLRRLYVQHKALHTEYEEGLEIPLKVHPKPH